MAGSSPRLASNQSMRLGWPLLGKQVGGCCSPPSSCQPAAAYQRLIGSSACVALKSPAMRVGSPDSSAASSHSVRTCSEVSRSLWVPPW